MTNFSHHTLTLGIGDKLYLAPLDKDKVKVRRPETPVSAALSYRAPADHAFGIITTI